MTDGRPTLNTSQTQHHTDEKTCMTLMTVGLSNTTSHKNIILKYESLGNQQIPRQHRPSQVSYVLQSRYSLGRRR
jgi:hypothetical protein